MWAGGAHVEIVSLRAVRAVLIRRRSLSSLIGHLLPVLMARQRPMVPSWQQRGERHGQRAPRVRPAARSHLRSGSVHTFEAVVPFFLKRSTAHNPTSAISFFLSAVPDLSLQPPAGGCRL